MVTLFGLHQQLAMFILLLAWISTIQGMTVHIDTGNITLTQDLTPDVDVLAASPTVESLAKNNSASSSTNAVVNTYVLTLFTYENNQVYVYCPTSNNDENKNDSKKWIFYYVPVMLPAKQEDESDDEWIWSSENEIRVRLMLGNSEVETLARHAVSNKYHADIVKDYSKYWDVAPLMIDSLMAYIISSDSSPVAGVKQYHAVHPTTMIMTMRFSCTSKEIAEETVEKIISGDYEIEVSLYFAELKQVKTNFASITADQVKSVVSKTTADGGGTSPEYIHRNQASKFVGSYVTNVKKMIYIEDASLDMAAITAGLDDQLMSLFRQGKTSDLFLSTRIYWRLGMDESKQITLDVGLYTQVWSSADLNPDRITSELHKLFSKNDSETARSNNSNTYFNLDTDYLRESSKSASGSASVGGSFMGIGATASASASTAASNSLHDQLSRTNHDVFSLDEIQKLLTEQQVEVEWKGEKFQPKSFSVYKLTDLTDQLQIAIIAKQFSIDKKRGAIIRTISTLDGKKRFRPNRTSEIEEPKVERRKLLTGSVQLYAGKTPPPMPWLLCNGSQVSRSEFKSLFDVIGQAYGAGDGNTTFHLPDFRGRVAVGVDDGRVNIALNTTLGVTGGQLMHRLTIDQVPAHQHSAGTLSTSSDGLHSHSIYDPGHDHGGKTGSAGPLGPGGWGMTPRGHGSDQSSHSHSIPTGSTSISIYSAGVHSHRVAAGETGAMGGGQAFSLMQPYQTVNYIIYAE